MMLKEKMEIFLQMFRAEQQSFEKIMFLSYFIVVDCLTTGYMF